MSLVECSKLNMDAELSLAVLEQRIRILRIPVRRLRYLTPLSLCVGFCYMPCPCVECGSIRANSPMFSSAASFRSRRRSRTTSSPFLTHIFGTSAIRAYTWTSHETLSSTFSEACRSNNTIPPDSRHGGNNFTRAATKAIPPTKSTTITTRRSKKNQEEARLVR